jgi:ADP-ribosylglycohydrolase
MADRARGCLLGGAVGDALGAPVEFLTWERIRERYGPAGIEEFAPAYGLLGAVTDDTQLTMWTAEGVLRGLLRAHLRGVGGPMSVLPRSYLRWMFTQDGYLPSHVNHQSLVLGDAESEPGWMLGIRALHARRAPGTTCLSALRDPEANLWERSRNDSKGCGGVMRVAPIALLQRRPPDELFELGCQAAAITHGHPTGILAAGAFVSMLVLLREGGAIDEAVRATMDRLRSEPSHEETTAALQAALRLAESSHEPSPRSVESLGGGWTAESALAIATYASLVAGDDFARGVRLAVNHSGDSDSAGSLTGQLLGIRLGVQAIPARWRETVELGEELVAVADDLLVGVRESRDWWVRYPGY